MNSFQPMPNQLEFVINLCQEAGPGREMGIK